MTPQEIADGWILLFDGNTTFGWKIDGDASVKDGLLKVGKNTKARLTTAFGSFELDYEYKVDDERFGSATFNLMNGMEIGAKAPLAGPREDAREMEGKKVNETWKRHIHKLEVTRKDRMWTWSSKGDGGGGITASSEPKTYQTTIEFRTELFGEPTLTLRNVKLKPIGQTAIFNGKDLTGWQEIPGKKLKFTVNDKGELNVKDGNGDLQTTGEWDDFVLQLDVISNGKHLNSGVFFRCLPGQFWSGYEAQIRNQWQGDDRTKPVDYGTGGIYNRQPARKVVSTDHEWFTMTVVAHGNHLATWVNGYQVTDFTDTRPPDMSARKGLKLDKGPISIQGHDPTTDLSFRNIRIEAMPKVANAK